MGANISITCNPPIGRNATLVLPPGAADGDVECVFAARFDTPEARTQARDGGARLELWSDIPWAGEAYGQWHALPFVWADQDAGKDAKVDGRVQVTPSALPPGDVPQPVFAHPALAVRPSTPPPLSASNSSAPSSPISTTTTAVDAVADAADAAPDLVLRFSTRFPTPIWGGPLRFCYTYRLVWPDGGVQWFGEAGSDGQLFVERKAAPESWRRPASVGRRTPSRTPARTPSPPA